jgi:tRNA-intron endonuclease
LKNNVVKVEILSDNKLIVWSPEESRRLFRNGFYGKPLGVSKPKEDFDSPLILDIIEGLYLLEKKMIKVYSEIKNRELELEELRSIGKTSYEGLEEKYLVYRHLRDTGLIVTPGIKYGCDFAVYQKGPGIDHAPFIVQVRGSHENLSATEIIKSGRLATSVRKTFIIAVIDGEEVQFLSFKWWKP